MLEKCPHQAPFFSDPAVHALQFLDVINMKDPSQKTNFFRNTLPEVLPYIPRVSHETSFLGTTTSGFIAALFLFD